MRTPLALCTLAIVLALLLSALARAGGDAPGPRFGWLDLGRVASDSRAAAQALAVPQNKLAEARAANQKRYDAVSAALRAAKTDADRKRFQDELAQVQRDSVDIERSGASEIEKARQQVKTAAIAIAKSIGARDSYTAILDTSVLYYAHMDLDVTNEVIALMDKPKGK